MKPLNWLFEHSGYLAAFLTAMAVVLVDCNHALRKAIGRVPVNILKSGQAWSLASLCGGVSAACFGFSNSDVIKQVVDLKWQNPLARGFLVGLAVLTILRSRLFNIKDSAVGGEFVYNLGCSWALDAIWQKWRSEKERFVTEARIQAAFRQVAFEDELEKAVLEAIQVKEDDAYKGWVRAQFASVKKTKPKLPPSAGDPQWTLYYRILIKLALDCGGVQAFATMPGFEERKRLGG